MIGYSLGCAVAVNASRATGCAALIISPFVSAIGVGAQKLLGLGLSMAMLWKPFDVFVITEQSFSKDAGVFVAYCEEDTVIPDNHGPRALKMAKSACTRSTGHAFGGVTHHTIPSHSEVYSEFLAFHV